MENNNSKNIFICNSSNQIRKLIKSIGQEKIYYVNLDYNSSAKIKELLSSFKIGDLTRELFLNSSSFKAEYAHCMRDLNRQNSSLLWWAMNFTNKNPLLTNLYNDVFYVSSLVNLVQNTDFRYLLIFSSNLRIARKLKFLQNELGINVYCVITRKFIPKDFLIHNLPIMIFYSATKTLFKKLLSRGVKRGSNENKLTNNLYLIATPFEDKSFKNFRFEDVYFKSLKEFFLSKGIKVMTVGFVSCKFKHLFLNKEPNVFPFEKFILPLDILKLLLKNLKLFLLEPNIKGMFIVSGINFTDFVKDEIKISINSGQMFLNLIIYSSALNLLKEHYPRKVFYPFENRSWEKMIVLAARDISKNIRLVGYQHASLTPKHTNLYLQKGEYTEIPFPDEIITMGYITKDIMIDLLNFPRDKLRVGCALRQSLPKDNVNRRLPDKINRILIALASSIDEYLKVLEFLDSAFSDSQPCRLIIRPHPIIDFKKALRLYKPRNIKYELDKGSLYESLSASDLVIYASSTVSLEAIYMGIPVVFVALDDVLSPDPLFNVSFLKWTCKDPKELIKLIENISKIDKAVFSGLQEKAQEFGRLYCVPATESSMEVFI